MWGRNSNLILWHVDIQLSQHCFLKRLFFPHLISWHFSENHLSINVWIYFWTLSSFPLVYTSVLIPVPLCFNYCCFVESSKLGSVSPPFCSSLWRLFWLFGAQCNSTWFWRLAFPFLWKKLLKFKKRLHWIYRLH